MLDEKSRRERKIKVKQEVTKTYKKKEKSQTERGNSGNQENRNQECGSVRNVSSQQELNLLYETLRKKNEEIPGKLEIEEDIQDTGRKKIIKIFYSNEQMKRNFGRYRDIVYIHRRMNDTRFKKILTLIIGIDNHGLNRIFAIALTSKDDIPTNEWIFTQFNSYMEKAKPMTIILERNKSVHKALASLYNGKQTSIVYCPYYIHKSLKFEFDGDLKRNNESLFDKIVNIPIIESQEKFEAQLAEVKNYAMMTNNDRHRNLIMKLDGEKNLWAT